MPDIKCPECKQITSLVAIRRAAEEFCPECDFPLFWAPGAAPMATPGANSETTMRRLPGAAGRHEIGTKVCPACGELNPIRETHCVRCTAELDPRPPEPAPPVPEVRLPEPVPEPEPERRRHWSIWALIALILLIELILLIVLIVD